MIFLFFFRLTAPFSFSYLPNESVERAQPCIPEQRAFSFADRHPMEAATIYKESYRNACDGVCRPVRMIPAVVFQHYSDTVNKSKRILGTHHKAGKHFVVACAYGPGHDIQMQLYGSRRRTSRAVQTCAKKFGLFGTDAVHH